MENKQSDWLQKSYICPTCIQGISHTTIVAGLIDQKFWIEQVLDFTNKHRKCGFKL